MNNNSKCKFVLDAFLLKIIAIFAMTCNHIAIVFEELLPVYIKFPLNIIGGITFPIMAYLLIEGYNNTSNVKKYMLRMLFFGLLSLFPFFWVLGWRLNVLFTLLLGLFCLYIRDRIQSKALFWLCFVGILSFTVLCDWSIVGVLLIFLYGTVKGEKRRIILPTLTVSLIGLILSTLLTVLNDGWKIEDLLLSGGFALAGLIVIPLLFAYNGKRGYSPSALRYLFYIFYPVHLLVLLTVKFLIT